MSKILITGGAGFIGSNMVDRFMKEDHQVTVIDNLCLGKKELIAKWLDKDNFNFEEIDLLDFEKVKEVFKKNVPDLVIHLAANSEIPTSFNDPEIDLRQGTLATYNVLEAMREADTKKIIFASSSVIYGEAKVKPTPEDYGPLLPISFYGANKLACEGLISSYCHIFNFQSWIFRFANVVGRNSTHGVTLDFIKKLKKNNQELEILGDGKQSKSYLDVDDCIEGILFAYKNAPESVNYFNLTCSGNTTVDQIASIVVKTMDLDKVDFKYTGGKRGWPGDVTQAELSGEKLKKLGWQAKKSSTESIESAAKAILEQL